MSRTSRDEDIERRRAKARQKALEAKGRQGTKRPSRQKKAPIVRLRLIVIGVLAICLIALVLRVISYVGGISKVHLNDEGLTHAKRYENFIKVHGIDVSE